MNFCTKCGTKLSPSCKYCPVCGCSVSTPSEQDSLGNCSDSQNGERRQLQQMSGADRKIIEVSKGKLFLALLGSLAFVFMALFLMSVDSRPSVIVASLLGIFFFGGGAIAVLCRLRSSSFGMVLDSEGFTIPMKREVVRWAEVTGYRNHNFLGSQFLVVMLKNPKEVIRRMGWSETVYRMNIEMYGSPLVISSSNLSVNFDEFFALFDQYYRKYGINR